jgi:hypothetical protein
LAVIETFGQGPSPAAGREYNVERMKWFWIRVGLRIVLVAVLALFLAGGCGTARMVVIEKDGGVVAVPDNSEAHMEKAMMLMRENCRGEVDVYRQEEVPVGSRVTDETTTSRNIFDEIETTREYRVRRKYEWRIFYRCQ